MTFRRHPHNPILTRSDIPDIPSRVSDPTSVFNPGAVKLGERYVLLLRVQTRGRETVLVRAESADGVRFEVANQIVPVEGIGGGRERIHHVYDPRITPLEGTNVVTLAMDTDAGCRIAMARSKDLRRLEFLGMGDDDVRNAVVFPERVGGRYLRLERPNPIRDPGGPTTGDTIVLTESSDLLSWRSVGPIMTGRPHYWDERIGPGPPPIKTRDGWLLVYHGVSTHFGSVNIYQVGVALLDLDEPLTVRARGRCNVLEPREPCERVGQVPNVVFPSGLIVDDVDSDGFADPTSGVFLYYGAADTAVALATTTTADLLAACHE